MLSEFSESRITVSHYGFALLTLFRLDSNHINVAVSPKIQFFQPQA